MLTCLIWLVIVAIVLAVVYWAITAVLGAFSFAPPPPILKLIQVLIVLILILYALQCLFGVFPECRPHGWGR